MNSLIKSMNKIRLNNILYIPIYFKENIRAYEFRNDINVNNLEHLLIVSFLLNERKMVTRITPKIRENIYDTIPFYYKKNKIVILLLKEKIYYPNMKWIERLELFPSNYSRYDNVFSYLYKQPSIKIKYKNLYISLSYFYYILSQSYDKLKKFNMNYSICDY